MRRSASSVRTTSTVSAESVLPPELCLAGQEPRSLAGQPHRTAKHSVETSENSEEDEAQKIYREILDVVKEPLTLVLILNYKPSHVCTQY